MFELWLGLGLGLASHVVFGARVRVTDCVKSKSSVIDISGMEFTLVSSKS